MRKLILRNGLSLGDIVLLTATVRDLHRCYPGQFVTDVRTTFHELWEHNPHLTGLDEDDPEVETLDCHYPLIDWSNRVPYHNLHGFIDFLNERLGLEVKCTEFKGDIHLSRAEKAWASQAQELTGEETPFWLIAAGGKHDVTIKWWDSDRYQAVVDHFRGRIQFVQVGAAGDHHPGLAGTIDLRGQTSVRQLARLVYHAQGVLCGVTGLMHLAAAVEPKYRTGLRPCVVVAGGREPAHWEAYPNHQFIHTIGALPCCAAGGCWRSRTVPLGDGDERDRPEHLCVSVRGRLPRCMDMISAAEVIRRIESYFEGDALRELDRRETRAAARAVKATRDNPFDQVSLTSRAVRGALEDFMRGIPEYPGGFRGRGIVICAGGVKYFTNAWVCLNVLRRVLGCTLPIQLWHLGPRELDERMKALVAPLKVECVDAEALRQKHPARLLRGWELKPYAILHSPFQEVLLLDADNVPVRDPEFLFEAPQFRRAGAIFWPDEPNVKLKPQAWQLCGLTPRRERAFESGQIVVDKQRCWKALALCMWMNEHSDFFYAHTFGDKETFHLAFRKLDVPFAMPRRSPRGKMRQYDFQGRLLFQHRNTDKWNAFFPNKPIRGFRLEAECRQFLQELQAQWDFKVGGDATRASRPPRAFRAARLVAMQSRAGVPPAHPAPPHIGKAGGTPALLCGVLRAEAGNGSLTLVTLHDERMAPVGRVTARALQAYAQRHGYRFVYHDRLIDPGRHPAWNKILAVRQALLAQKDGWVMWVDADARVMNLRVRAESLIPPERDLIFASDSNGLMSGIFLVRCCEWSLKFLETVFFLGDLKHDPDGFGPKWEQNTIKHLLQNFGGCADHVLVLPPRALNSSLDNFEPGDFILHLGAMTNGARIRALRQAEQWVVS
jgi:ADP-heptose:LPS heptosyltransferase